VDDIKSFLKDIEKKTGAQLFVLAAYEKSDETVAITKYVISTAISRNSPSIASPRFQTQHRLGDKFTESMPRWKERTWHYWELYAQDQFGELLSINKLNNLFIPSDR
jgi:hypothetical protein